MVLYIHYTYTHTYIYIYMIFDIGVLFLEPLVLQTDTLFWAQHGLTCYQPPLKKAKGFLRTSCSECLLLPICSSAVSFPDAVAKGMIFGIPTNQVQPALPQANRATGHVFRFAMLDLNLRDTRAK